jgi:hypothetical protein
MAEKMKKIDNLYIYNGFKVDCVERESGLFLRVDSAKLMN